MVDSSIFLGDDPKFVNGLTEATKRPVASLPIQVSHPVEVEDTPRRTVSNWAPGHLLLKRFNIADPYKGRVTSVVDSI